ncbi:adenosine deaminase 2-like [Toxorhynchites rutilus septentrionalis]|uniref:adenosine deaminase 2-like n=1 Tax=Toxorhynchites rutilus septentrionalis TaxID=329112 RepID=UPI00247AD9AC|nr:adenosine deaminase 2-like [Toxorhynchites rutilus septentrionalis]
MKYLLLSLPFLFCIKLYETKAVITTDAGEPFFLKRPSLEAYNAQRKHVIEAQERRFLGASLNLTNEEEIVNRHIMKLKRLELDEGFKDSFEFIPARHIFEKLDQLNSSKLFQFIRRIPKGAVLHAHDSAIGSTDLLINATYRPYLWQNGRFEQNTPPAFIFSKTKPAGKGWELVSDIRNEMKAEIYDEKLRDLFGLYTKDPINAFRSINVVWDKFQQLFVIIEPIVSYEPVWRQYYYDSLKEYYDDQVSYLELRGVLPEVYDLTGKIYTPEEVVQIYVDETERFMKNYPNFLGAKFVYAPQGFGDDDVFRGLINILKRLHEKFPKFVAGFDLVGQEDKRRPLLDFVPEFLKLPESIQFFFHAGETNWFGMKSDANMIDAILLGTKRIGHGFPLIKHPLLLEVIKRKQICVEVNPISNQVLKLVEDFRNHPAALLFVDDYPVVVSSDDRSFWRATPLSHDFYMAFLGIASAQHDLRLLKQLAINSIRFSAMDDLEKTRAMSKWEVLTAESQTQVLNCGKNHQYSKTDLEYKLRMLQLRKDYQQLAKISSDRCPPRIVGLIKKKSIRREDRFSQEDFDYKIKTLLLRCDLPQVVGKNGTRIPAPRIVEAIPKTIQGEESRKMIQFFEMTI